MLPTSAACETNAVLSSIAQTLFPPLDGGDWPEPLDEYQESPILLSRRVTVCSGGVDRVSSGGSPIVMHASAGGADGSCSVRASSADASGLSDSSDGEESFAVMRVRFFTEIPKRLSANLVKWRVLHPEPSPPSDGINEPAKTIHGVMLCLDRFCLACF